MKPVELTLWLCSLSAPAIDLRQHHDGLGQKTHEEPLSTLQKTYEDWEPGFGTPYDVVRTNELHISSFDKTPNLNKLAETTEYTRKISVLIANFKTIHQTEAFGIY